MNKPDFLKVSNLKKKPICMAPWTNFYAKITPDGYNAKVCCVNEDSVDVKNISEYFESDMLKNITSSLEKGELPNSCRRCEYNPDFESYENEIDKKKRKRNVIAHKHDYESLTIDDLKVILEHDDDKFIQLDLRPSNLCNLKCRMCNSSSSTEIAKESLKIISDNDFISDLRETTTSASALTSFDEKYFKKYAEDYTSNDDHKNRVREIFKYANLQRLKLLGGEPSIDPAIISVMKDLKEDRIKKSNGFRLQITTNMTNINKTWLDYFQVFNAKITASIDGAGRTYEYIRYPAKWNRIESNIKALTPETGSNDLSMNLVMSNILFLDIKHWIPILNNLALEKSFKLNFIECFYPTYMMPSNIPYEYKMKILEDIKHLKKYDLSSNIRDFLDKSERYLESIANEDPDMNNLKAFFLINMKQDKLRKQNIFDINYTKEIYNKMNKGANNDRSKQI